MRALYMMSGFLSVVIAMSAAANNVNPYAVTDWDRATCQDRFGNHVWNEEIQACVCRDRLYDARAGSCLSKDIWSDYQTQFGPTDPVMAVASAVVTGHPQPYYPDDDGDGYSAEHDADDTDPDVNPAMPALKPHENLRDATVSEKEIDEAYNRRQAELDRLERERETEELARKAELERREREAGEEARREAEEIERARAERETREAEREAELEQREQAAEEARRAKAEEESVVATRAVELELEDDEDYFEEGDDDVTFDPEAGLELVTSEEVEEKPDLDEGIEYDHGFNYSDPDAEADAALDIEADLDGDGIKNLDDFCPDEPGIPSDDRSLNGCPAHMHPDEDEDATADAKSVNFEDLPEVDEGPTESPAERRARLKAEREAERDALHAEREAERERKRREREQTQARRERERKLRVQAERLASLEWEKGHISYRQYQGDESVDTDRDGLPDDMDLCPTESEDFDNLMDEAGYPMPLDGCPDEAHGYISLHWDPENQRFDDIRPTRVKRWDNLDGSFWFYEDGSYTEEAIELMRELTIVLEAYDLKVEVKGRSLHGENANEKLEHRHTVGRWAKALATELKSQCVEAGNPDCAERIYESSATGYSGIKHNTIILSIMTH